MRKKPTIHYFFNRHFFAGDYRPQLEIPGLTTSYDPRKLLSADVVLVHLPSILSTNVADQLLRLHSIAPSSQVWVAQSMESAANYPHMFDHGFMSIFQLEVSYRQEADIWTPYVPRTLKSEYQTIRPGNRRRRFCSFVSSSWDLSERRKFMKELSRLVKIDSYGHFMRNKWLLLDRGETTKLRILQKYVFTLALENSIAHDYVTEKFYQPLMTGTIPIYLGAPNIDEFAPGENCFINATDFAGPEELASFLDDIEPTAYHDWRRHDLRIPFMQKVDRLAVNWQVELSKQLLEAI